MKSFLSVWTLVLLSFYGRSQNNVGIGITNPVSTLDVAGGLGVGTAYSGIYTAPANGFIVEGNVGIGIPSPTAKLHIVGGVKLEAQNSFEFGSGIGGKELNAGKIGYGIFTPNSLDIVGAGNTASSRKIKFWNEGGAHFSGPIGIGAIPATSAALDIQSTTGALIVPRMTTIQRDALTAVPGMIIFNLDSLKFQGAHQTGSLGGVENIDVSNPVTGNSLPCWQFDSVGQSFLIVNPGTLTRIELNVDEVFNPGTFDFKVRSGNTITGPILSLNSGVNISSTGVISIVLSTPIPVSVGQQYTFQFSTTTNSIAEFLSNSMDPYPDGHAWLTDPVLSSDLWFKTYVTSTNTLEYPWYNLSHD